MLISIEEQSKVWGVRPKGVIHVGGHSGEEFDQYKKLGWGKIIWVEAQPEMVTILRENACREGDKVIEAAVWDLGNISLNFNVASNSESSSLLSFGTHSEAHPEITYSNSYPVLTSTLDSIIELNFEYDYLALDIQGVELRALKGFTNGIKQINWICTEVNERSVYENCAQISEIDDFLRELGFIRAVTRMTSFGWGDALYARKELLVKNTLKTKFNMAPFVAKFMYLRLKMQVKDYLKRSRRVWPIKSLNFFRISR